MATDSSGRLGRQLLQNALNAARPGETIHVQLRTRADAELRASAGDTFPFEPAKWQWQYVGETVDGGRLYYVPAPATEDDSAVTRDQHAAIRAAYLAGEPVGAIAAAAQAPVAEVETYLAAWCGQGCPEGAL